MDVATMKKDLENQIGDINKELENIYLPHDAVLIFLGKRTAFEIALELIDSLQQEQQELTEVDLEKLGEIARHIIAVKHNVEDIRLNEDEWSLLERIGYPHKL